MILNETAKTAAWLIDIALGLLFMCLLFAYPKPMTSWDIPGNLRLVVENRLIVPLLIDDQKVQTAMTDINNAQTEKEILMHLAGEPARAAGTSTAQPELCRLKMAEIKKHLENNPQSLEALFYYNLGVNAYNSMNLRELTGIASVMNSPQSIRRLAKARIEAETGFRVVIRKRAKGFVEGVVMDFWRSIALPFRLSESRLPASIARELRRFDLARSAGLKCCYALCLLMFLAARRIHDYISSHIRYTDGGRNVSTSTAPEDSLDEFKRYISSAIDALKGRRVQKSPARFAGDQWFRRFYFEEVAAVITIVACISAGIAINSYINPAMPSLNSDRDMQRFIDESLSVNSNAKVYVYRFTIG